MHRMPFALGAAAVLLGSGAAVAAGLTRTIDLAFTIWLQSFASDTLDALANLNTIVGQSSVDVAVAALLALALWRRGPRYAWLVPPALLGLTAAIELLGKLALAHPGPPHNLVRTSFNPLGLELRLPSSFPSGHVARTTSLALLVAGLVPAAVVRALLIALIAVTPLARIYLGDHWLSDTVGGLALGALSASLALAALRRLSAR